MTDECPKCGKLVGFAEKVFGLNCYWHPQCFACHNCGKVLNPSRCDDHESKPYCRPCYRKEFQPKGLGFGTDMSTGISVKADASGDKTGPEVFVNEKRKSVSELLKRFGN